ncbi:hypothetical protein NQ318_021406 [Aromia moschata]|uniref:Uncharacterized protein n=1 Tax=Aromia moschata TaxID=1265417 RepID=A0AAV8ZCZ4_9CUCU|nr:hypothetical protein NQ318_021406 [Aromia moschata]
MPQKKIRKKSFNKDFWRLKKSTNNVNVVLKKFEVEKSWDEKTDEFEGDFVEQVDEEGNISYIIRKVEPRRRRKTVSSSEDVKDTGVKRTLSIYGLYCRNISGLKMLVALQEYAGRHLKLSALPSFGLVYIDVFTAMALHYSYSPFVNRLKSTMTTMEEHPDTLRRRMCESLWYQKQKQQWVYYFKMREKRDIFLQHSRRTDFKQPDLLEILDDVSANPGEYCRVLQVTCKHFIGIPPVIGQVLTSVSLTLSEGFRHHRLQLSFGTGINYGHRSADGASCSTIILDPVINYRVLDWWHPFILTLTTYRTY